MITECRKRLLVLLCLYVMAASNTEKLNLGQVVAGKDILVLYHFLSPDVISLENFLYFLNSTILKNPEHCDYIFFVPIADIELPPLPPPSKYVALPGNDGCNSTWAACGTSLKEDEKLRDLISIYKYIFLVDSEVRGPFIPPSIKWIDSGLFPMVEALPSNRTALVGSIITCQGSEHPTASSAPKSGYGIPYVSTHSAILTQAAFQLVLEGGLFDCKHPPHDGVLNDGDTNGARSAESRHQYDLDASVAVLRSGWGIDCLMIRYQGIDWLDDQHWGCNAKMVPTVEFGYDGIHLNPYEVVFVPVNNLLVQQGHMPALEAQKYELWLSNTEKKGRNVGGNQYKREMPRYTLPKILEKLAHDKECFDYVFYLSRNKDLCDGPKSLLKHQNTSDLDLVWEHFVYFGQFEPRQYRFNCTMNYQQYAGFRIPQ
ncbi:hypothetical protein CEUSTIGMA_g12508.t1 [Chlamydomonas eustigma]|uniref:Exostosin GT47 domain-containing protein n=1 Tax=Chlamydomonas eustigma TaxID=1157962 RepID=A0A250XPV1_9CHLO|nr:hypothetical protein CEUSTIGMA_g12508.t1 [Chlamydomonas eustigma]|eukprot:GAX85088.1 hypothetical protein CEUSTIGMA_g12508.t1 [Chlamydomonas eustigma]